MVAGGVLGTNLLRLNFGTIWALPGPPDLYRLSMELHPRNMEASMCGITGWVDYSRDLTRERSLIVAMTETMACRGPDASGVWLDRNAAVGHRRLAVIDLPGGTQPMTVSTPSGDVVMVYSGEAYNFTELRDELIQHGHRFQTSSDTEVVLRSYLQWGTALAEQLNGMYAFAIWDARTASW